MPQTNIAPGSSTSFSRQLLWPVGGLVVLTFGIASLLGSVFGSNATHFLVQKIVSQANEGLETHLRRYLEKPHLLTRINADALHSGQITTSSLFAAPEHWFADQQQQFPEVDDIYFGRADGAIVGIDKVRGRSVLKLTTAFPRREFFELDDQGRRGPAVRSEDYDATQRNWYRAAITKAGPVWSDVYVLLNRGELGISAARPAIDAAGHTVGVMGANLTLSSISEYLREHAIGPRSVAYIVERNGQLVATSASTQDLVGSAGDARRARVQAAEASNRLVAASHQALMRAGEAAADAAHGPMEMDLDGERLWIYRSAYRDALGLDWSLVTVVDPEPYLQGVRQLALVTLALGGVALGLLLFMVPRFTRKMALPLKALAEASGRVAAGDYGTTVPVQGNAREIDQLAQAFNDMSRSLVQARDRLLKNAQDLESQVQARTAELTQLNGLYENERNRAQVASENKTRFLAHVSHEIRTPLNAISGLAYLLRSEPDRADAAEQLLRIESASRFVASIVNSVLEFSKIEAGGVELQQVPLHVPAIIDHVTGMLRQEAQARGLRLHGRVGPMPEGLVGDPMRLQQALLNLASNAVRATAQGSVTVEAMASDVDHVSATVHFKVTDTGPGLPADSLEGLFERYKQGDQARGSVGLGLAITRELARSMGGDAWAESVLGTGSCFSFKVRLARLAPAPDAPQPAQQAGAASDQPSPSGAAALRALLSACTRPPRALVVDDDAVNQLVAQAMLQQAGLSVVTASGGAEGVQAATAEHFDVILMDVSMPGTDGLSATRQIRATALNADTPIIGFSGHAFDDDRSRGLGAGMNDFLIKPVDPDQFFGAVKQALARRILPAGVC
ncbi:response regulator [Ideonella sp. DXS29W]|uniref:histidine kinase n=1 Tax=Ideonella lacteola TaxID=2984193 RepID=A0ABU9BXU1_9BURK